MRDVTFISSPEICSGKLESDCDYDELSIDNHVCNELRDINSNMRIDSYMMHIAWCNVDHKFSFQGKAVSLFLLYQ